MKNLIHSKKFITILCCVLSFLLVVGIVFTYQQVHKTKYIMQCVFFRTGIYDLEDSYYFTLSKEGVFTVSIGTYQIGSLKANAKRWFLVSDNVLQNIEKSSQRTLTVKECTDLEALLTTTYSKYEQSMGWDSTLYDPPIQGWCAAVIYKGDYFSYDFENGSFEEFTSIAKRLKELSPLIIDYSIWGLYN